MKTTTVVHSTKQTTDQENQIIAIDTNLSPLRSLRPQKSMVRVKSLKPKRVIGQRRLHMKAAKLS